MIKELYRVLAVVLMLLLVLSCGTSRRAPKQAKEGTVKSSVTTPEVKSEEAKQVEGEAESTPETVETPLETETTPLPAIEAEITPEAVEAPIETESAPESTPTPAVEAEITPEAVEAPIETESIPETVETPPISPVDFGELGELITPIELGEQDLMEHAPLEMKKSEKEDSTLKKADSTKLPIKETPKPAIAPVEQAKTETKQKPKERDRDDGKKQLIIEADIMRPIKLSGDSTAMNLIGNVVMYHNGAVITCDSAVRYSPTRADCFKRVVINKETTFIYGDRASYNGDINLARVFAPIIKMVDEDATLYTYYFTFNTLDNIVEYRDGGTMTQNGNQMESKRGYYYTSTRELVGVDQVELRDEQYKLMSDSVVYNMDTETAYFYTTTHIWSKEGDILIADRGSYNRLTGLYNFTENSYILSENQEIWSDSLDYDSNTESAKLYRNIQIREEEKHITAFGDYGEYWGEREEAMLTLDPSIMSYDPQEPDTLYMRADSMFLFSHPYEEEIDWSGGRASKNRYDDAMFGEEIIETTPDSSAEGSGEGGGEGGGEGDDKPEAGLEVGADGEPTDSLLIESPKDSVNLDSLTPKELARYHKEQARELKQKVRDAKHRERQQASEAKLKAESEAREAKLKAREEIRKAKRDAKKGVIEEIKEDSLLLGTDTLALDSIKAQELADSMVYTQIGVDEDGEAIYDSVAVERQSVDADLELDEDGNPIKRLEPGEVEEPQDSLQRVIRAFRNVRVFRDDFQVICDSLVGFTKDSTLHLYIDPVLWAQGNQVKADTIDVFIENQELYKAEFYGSPFMSSEVDPESKYNQVKGRYMEAWFRDNEIYKNDVIGNGETIYYMQDEDTGDYMGLLAVECADITFLIDGQKMDKIIYKVNPVAFIYPMESIPPEQPEFLEGFIWEDERRPKGKEEIMSREVRPTQREQIKAIPEPEFPLTDSIIKDRDFKIQNGIWQERNDKLSQRALDFIHFITTN